MIEQTGSIFFECDNGYFVSSIFSDVIVRDKNFNVLPDNQKGLIQLMSVLPTSYPGHNIITEDIGKITRIKCNCGLNSTHFKIYEELKKLKLEVVAMQDKIKFIDSMKVIINKPFDELSIRFLEDLSGEIKKINKIYTYPDLVYLMMWCAKKNLLKLKKKYKSNSFKIGRGLVFHVCPNNVPVNFIYSFIIGLLSGNSNIVKLPSKNFKERNILLKSINKLFNLKRYQDFKKSNLFINYDHEQENYLTEHISSKSDARIIWGGDKTIETLKKIITPARCIDVCFADRYSVSIINGKKFNLLKQSSLDLLARKYFYDVYSMDQLACNSPHFLFWIGK